MGSLRVRSRRAQSQRQVAHLQDHWERARGPTTREAGRKERVCVQSLNAKKSGRDMFQPRPLQIPASLRWPRVRDNQRLRRTARLLGRKGFKSTCHAVLSASRDYRITESMAVAARGDCRGFRLKWLTSRAIGAGLKRPKVHHGMNRRDAERVARKIGATVSPLRRTGEKECVFPSGRRVRLNARRKDAPRSLVAAILSEI